MTTPMAARATRTDEAPTRSPLLVPVPYRVIHKEAELPDTVTLHVVPVEGELPAFAPAQVSMLGVFGVGEAAISISSSTSTSTHHAYTIRGAGAISNALVNTPVGGVITVRGPFGNSWPIADSKTKDLVILAGGLGIAPLRAAIEEVAANRSNFDRVAVVYGARTPSLVVYPSDLERWRNMGLDVLLTVDDTEGDGWPHAIGVVPDLLGPPEGLELNWADTTAFVCGPDVMMHFAAEKLLGLGCAPEHVWLTIERNMQCGNALCGHCQLGPFLVCRDGPVVNYADIGRFHRVREL